MYVHIFCKGHQIFIRYLSNKIQACLIFLQFAQNFTSHPAVTQVAHCAGACLRCRELIKLCANCGYEEILPLTSLNNFKAF